jgi:OOP family OmpA-OmpF porin
MRLFATVAFLLGTAIWTAAQPAITFHGPVEALDSVNTPDNEGFIAIHPSGDKLVFTTTLSTSNIGGKMNPGDLWVTSLESGVWQKASPSANLDPQKLITALGFVNQGEMLLYNATHFNRGVYEGAIMVGDFNQGTVTNLRKLDIPYFNNISEHQSGSISADGKHIVVAMEGTSSYGVEDLYVCHLLNDGSWSAPKNMGYRLNTPFQEYTPYLAADNETLFFSSNGRDDGAGSFDVYMTQRVDDTWQNWTQPINLGQPVNTQGSETSFKLSPDGAYAYYVSTTDSDGYGDIKRIKIRADIEADSSRVTDFEIKDEKVEYIKSFMLINQESREEISGTVIITSDTLSEIISVPTVFTFYELGDIQLEAKSEGYLSKQQLIAAAQLMSEDTISILLEPLDVGTTIQLRHVLFYKGTANFIEGSQRELDLVIEMMNENPRIKIDLAGHTDNVGDPILNLELSNERVRVVKEYLINKGISFSRITGKGYGGNKPLVPNDTEANKRLNRRVEFTIVEN